MDTMYREDPGANIQGEGQPLSELPERLPREVASTNPLVVRLHRAEADYYAAARTLAETGNTPALELCRCLAALHTIFQVGSPREAEYHLSRIATSSLEFAERT